MNTGKFRAMDSDELIARLGKENCSIDPSRFGYVIGPDVNGRLAHVASCRDMKDAEEYAKQLNALPKVTYDEPQS